MVSKGIITINETKIRSLVHDSQYNAVINSGYHCTLRVATPSWPAASLAGPVHGANSLSELANFGLRP